MAVVRLDADPQQFILRVLFGRFNFLGDCVLTVSWFPRTNNFIAYWPMLMLYLFETYLFHIHTN